MAYNGYFPQTYYPNYYGNQQMPQASVQAPQATQQTSGNNINWVQGEAGAKSYPVGAGQSVFLMDSEDSVFYIKTVDASGMPQPLRIFDYTERSSQAAHTSSVSAPKLSDEYVSRKEFDAFKSGVLSELKDIKIEEGEG